MTQGLRPKAFQLWITRARPGAEATADRLRALGHTPIIAPLLRVRPLSPRIDLSGVGAIALTSPNGVAALARLSSERSLPVHAVGDATAEAARQAGFATVASASGDVQALAALITANHKPASGAVLIAGAREPAGDLPGALEQAGLSVKRAAAYATVPSPGLRGLKALKAGRLDGALIHSPRAGERLAALIAADDLAPLRRTLCAFCISEAAARPLIGLGLAAITTAAQPDETSLLSLIPPGPLGKPVARV